MDYLYESPDSPGVDSVYEPSEVVDNRPPRSPERNNTLTLQAAILESAQTGSNILESLDSYSRGDRDPETSLRILTREYNTGIKESAIEEFLQNPGDDPASSLMEARNFVEQIDSEADDPDIATARAASGGQLDDEARRIGMQIKILKMLQEVSEEMPWYEKAWEGVKLLIPGNILKTNKMLSGKYFGGREYAQNLVLGFKSLPAEDQERLLPEIREYLLENTASKFDAMSILASFMEPAGEEGLMEFSNWLAALDLTDISLLTVGLSQRAARLSARLNAVRTLRNLGEHEAASDLASAAVVSRSGRAVSGMEPDEIAATSLGFNRGTLDPAFTEGISSATMDRIRNFQRTADETVEAIEGEGFFIRESFLQDTEYQRALESSKTALREEGLENIQIVSSDKEKVTFAYEETIPVYRPSSVEDFERYLEGSLAPVEVRRTGAREMELTLDDVGMYTQTSDSVLSRFFASPTAWAKGELKEDVLKSIRLDSAQSKVFRELIELSQEAYRSILGPAGLKGLNPTSRKRLAQLDEVLRVGDEQSRVFTYRELRAGVNGIPLDEKQAEAYFKIRGLMDRLFHLRNTEERKSRVIRGDKEIILDENVVAIGRPYDTPQSGSLVLRKGDPKIIWNLERQEFERVEGLDLSGLYDNGQRIIRLDTPTKIPGTNEKVNFVIGRADDVRELPQTILRYREGYVPKVNLDANYFVKEYLPTRVDGKDIKAGEAGSTVMTLRMFATKKEARQWAENLSRREPDRFIRVLEDRQLEMEARANIVDGQSSGGFGLYTGSRASDMIPFGLEGQEPKRLGAFESISRNIAALSRHIPRNEFNMGMEQRILNTANDLIPGGNFKSYSDLHRLPDTEAGTAIRKMVNTLEEWKGMPSKEEQLWSAMMQSVYEKIVGLPGDKFVAWAGTKDPIAAARASAFNLLLGWGSVAQLVVQASGASVAASMNLLRPVELAKVLSWQSVLSAADWTQTTSGLNRISKSSGIPVEELNTLLDAWRRTGLREGTMTTADHAAIISGRGAASSVVSRGAALGRIAYNVGELFNRRTSFITAYREWRQANPEFKAGQTLTDKDLQQILTRTNNFLLNLHRSNRAQWQKGALSLPTMFLQIATKFGESATGINGAFTGSERAKLIAGQVLLFGSAGIPLGGFLLNATAGLMGLSQEEIEREFTAEQIKTLNEGIAGWTVLAMFNADIEVANRLSLVRAIQEYTDRFLFEDSTMFEAFLGAFGSVASRFTDGFIKHWKPVALGGAEIRDIDPVQVAFDMSKAAASMNNLSKAIFMHNWGMMVDRKGSPTVKRDFSTTEKIAQAIGLQLSDMNQLYTLEELNRGAEQFRSDVTSRIVEIYWDYSNRLANRDLTQKDIERFERQLAGWMQILPTDRDRKLVRETVQRQLREGTSRMEKAWRQHRSNYNDGAVGMITDLRQVLTSKGILREGGHNESEHEEEMERRKESTDYFSDFFRD